MELKRFDKSDLLPRVAIVVGTRPGIVKMGPLVEKLSDLRVDNFLLHTGQHYSRNMDKFFFDELMLPQPLKRIDSTKDYSTHAEQTGEMMRGIEGALIEAKPKIVLVCGDANTNLAAGLAARKLGMVVGHVESGLRSHDWMMPEEHNRIILDHICELLFAPTAGACQNLVRDNVRGKIYLTGNTIVDSTQKYLEIANTSSKILERHGLCRDSYFLMTAHREENVDNRKCMSNILKGASNVAQRSNIPVIFNVHPRTKDRLDKFSLTNDSSFIKHIKRIEPVGYLDFLVLLRNARAVLTDSGGVQEEACIVKTPCVTLRENTERPETLSVGSNRLAGTDPDRMEEAIETMLDVRRDWEIPFGDGNASGRIAWATREVLDKGVELVDVSTEPRSSLGEQFNTLLSIQVER